MKTRLITLLLSLLALALAGLPKGEDAFVARVGNILMWESTGRAEIAGELQPDRYYLLSDAGSFFVEPAGDNEGFDSPEAAAEWARAHTVWPELDLSDGYAWRSCSGASSTRTRRRGRPG